MGNLVRFHACSRKFIALPHEKHCSFPRNHVGMYDFHHIQNQVLLPSLLRVS